MFQIQKGYMCVEGDNKENSRDSREYGPVPMGLTDGKVVFRVGVTHLRNGVSSPGKGNMKAKVVLPWKYTYPSLPPPPRTYDFGTYCCLVHTFIQANSLQLGPISKCRCGYNLSKRCHFHVCFYLMWRHPYGVVSFAHAVKVHFFAIACVFMAYSSFVTRSGPIFSEYSVGCTCIAGLCIPTSVSVSLLYYLSNTYLVSFMFAWAFLPSANEVAER